MIYARRYTKIAIILGLPALLGLLCYTRLAYVNDYRNEVYAKMDYIEHSADRPDILFLGSSRAAFLIDPRIIDSMCRANSYNLGLAGMNMPELRMLIRKCVAAGKKPATLVLNIDASSFDTGLPVFDFPDFLGYAARDTVVYNAMASLEPEYRYKWRYPLYRFLQLAATNDGLKVRALVSSGPVLAGSAEGYGGRAPASYKGYSPYYEGYHESIVKPFRMRCDERGFSLLKDIISFCRSQHIGLVMVTAPMYREYRKIFLNCDSILRRVGQVADSANAAYFNFANDPLFSHQEDYFNFVHLNASGARKYSIEIGRILQGAGSTANRH